MAPSTPASKSPSKALTKSGQSKALSTQLDPDMQRLYNVCIALSKSAAVPLQYINKPDWIFSTVVLGREFGLAPMTSLLNIATINGKPSMSVHLLLGLCMRHPQFAAWQVVESDDDHAIVRMWRKYPLMEKPIEYVGTFTREEAAQANLIKAGGAWMAWRKNMCLARAIAFVCRQAFADVLTGTYTLEEMDSEKYVDSFMADDMKAIDQMEDAELSGKVIAETLDSPKSSPKSPK